MTTGQRVNLPGLTALASTGTVVAWLAVEEDVKDVAGMATVVMRRVSHVVAVVARDDGTFCRVRVEDLGRARDSS